MGSGVCVQSARHPAGLPEPGGRTASAGFPWPQGGGHPVGWLRHSQPKEKHLFQRRDRLMGVGSRAQAEDAGPRLVVPAPWSACELSVASPQA